ncbi:ATP-binding protein [Alkalilimnicola sp. S0819]|uniref:ATP-binding protein n=1 Tax=Alkalilimnicola sp. S0819 TaxID=2613922 RepID=UPI0012621085|nr:ATP-binding protein [Alkalilimnicola sp. S0819]KAB7628315.1 ATP-binding protein [Alkalilimnicola sp. S0819]MPQ15213.1 DUF815 domain-containing protein [Alkalilimnicola sp. S0819]
MAEQDWGAFLERAEALMARLESMLPPARAPLDWERARALRWRRGRLEAIAHPQRVELASLRNIERQVQLVARNTRQFVQGLPANNALLWGSRGTGKSSLIKAMLDEFGEQGLRLVEVEPQELVDLPLISAELRDRPERFIIFCDDLSFEADDAAYKALKAALDGSLAAPPENVLIYASSNRRHLLPEYLEDNAHSRLVDTELHHGEAVEEKISLSERFGLWVSFHPFNQDAYLAIVHGWLEELGVTVTDAERLRADALRYALERGSRSGRVAWQFARDWAGRQGLARAER